MEWIRTLLGAMGFATLDESLEQAFMINRLKARNTLEKNQLDEMMILYNGLEKRHSDLVRNNKATIDMLEKRYSELDILHTALIARNYKLVQELTAHDKHALVDLDMIQNLTEEIIRMAEANTPRIPPNPEIANDPEINSRVVIAMRTIVSKAFAIQNELEKVPE